MRLVLRIQAIGTHTHRGGPGGMSLCARGEEEDEPNFPSLGDEDLRLRDLMLPSPLDAGLRATHLVCFCGEAPWSLLGLALLLPPLQIGLSPWAEVVDAVGWFPELKPPPLLHGPVLSHRIPKTCSSTRRRETNGIAPFPRHHPIPLLFPTHAGQKASCSLAPVGGERWLCLSKLYPAVDEVSFLTSPG